MVENEVFRHSCQPLTERFLDLTKPLRVIAANEKPLWYGPGSFFRVGIYAVKKVDGCILPPIRQVPLLDTHNPGSVANVLGSVRNFMVVGKNLECDVFFSNTPAGKEALKKVREGHLTDFSVGYKVLEYRLEEGIVPQIAGPPYRGPIMIITKWYLGELSIVPIGRNRESKPKELERIQRAARREPVDKALYAVFLYSIIVALIALFFG